MRTNKRNRFLKQIDDWEYCYCNNCKQIISSRDLEITDQGIRCGYCKSYAIQPPAWIHCPHHKVASLKCPKAGKGIRKTKHGYECQDRCSYRKQK